MPASSAALHARRRRVLLDLAAVGDPVAVGEGGDEHARASKVSVVHGPGAYPGARTLVGWPETTPCTCTGDWTSAVGDLLAGHDVGRPRRPARQPHPQPGGGAVRRRRLPDARPAPAGPPARAPRARSCGPARRSRAPRRATASWRCSAWPPSSTPACGSQPARAPDQADEGLAGAPGRGQAPPFRDQGAPPAARRGRLRPVGRAQPAKLEGGQRAGRGRGRAGPAAPRPPRPAGPRSAVRAA